MSDTNDSIVTIYSEHDDNYEIYCPHCKQPQVEHPVNLLMDTDGCADLNCDNCDNCDREFTLIATQIIEYVTSK